MAGTGQILSIIDDETNYSFSSEDGGGSSKSSPEQVISGLALPADEIRRCLYSWNSDKSYTTPLTQEWIVGYHSTTATAQSIVELSGTGPTETAANGFHIWIRPTTITTLDDGNVKFTGDSIDASGTVTSSDTETITIDNTANKVYVTTKRWQGSVTIGGDSPFAETMNIVIDHGLVDPWTHARMIRKLESAALAWRPSGTPWRIDWDFNYFEPGTTVAGGLNSIFTRSFTNADATPRTQVSAIGTDWHAQINQVVDPGSIEGFCIRLALKRIEKVETWMSFYQW